MITQHTFLATDSSGDVSAIPMRPDDAVALYVSGCDLEHPPSCQNAGLTLFEGKDGGRKLWYQRYVLYDLFGRLGGVHGERGTHEYYVRYFAFGTLPWAPFAVISVFQAMAKRLKSEIERTPADRFQLLVAIWAAMLDPQGFPDPRRFRTDRPLESYLHFGFGTHRCLGAPLARRELFWAFKAFLDRVDDFQIVPGKNNLRHHPNFCLRPMKELYIEFTKK